MITALGLAPAHRHCCIAPVPASSPPGFDWQILAALSTALAAFIAVLAVIDQYRRGRRTEGFDFLWRFTVLWDSVDSRTRRALVATDLLKRPRAVTRLTIDIVNFFEQVGLYVRSGAVNASSAWAMFYPFAVGYWYACQGEISLVQQEVPVQYIDFAYLVRRFMEIEAKERGGASIDSLAPTEEDVDELLRNEQELKDVISVKAPEAAETIPERPERQPSPEKSPPAS